MKMPLAVLTTLAAALSLPAASSAGIPPYVPDHKIVEGNPVIVAASLRPESIEYLPHETPDGVSSWQYRALLTVESVLRGKLEEVELPILIEYGIEPKVGGPYGLWREDYLRLTPESRETLKGQPIVIYASRAMFADFDPLVFDAAEKNLWFLRRVERRGGGGSALGLKGAFDLQPLELREYFMAYLAADPEAAVAEQVRRNPALAERAQEFLDHRQVERALEIQDPAERAEKLAPLYARSASHAAGEAREGILAAGAAAGPALLRLFPTLDPVQDWWLRQSVLGMLGEIGYRDAVPWLLQILAEQERFWSREDLQPGWWNDVEDERRGERQMRYGIVHSTVYALSRLADPRAREAMERTLRLWEAFNFENSQIVDECRWYLQALDKQNAAVQYAAGALLRSRNRP